jgi:glycine cleavage system H protein
MSYEVDNSAKYYKEHQWVKVQDDGTCLVGISDYAQKALKDIIMVDLPDEGDLVTQGEVFASIESVKAVNDVFSPISGEIIAANEDIDDTPESINENPYETWLVKIKPSNLDEDLAKLMSPEEYETFCQ